MIISNQTINSSIPLATWGFLFVVPLLKRLFKGAACISLVKSSLTILDDWILCSFMRNSYCSACYSFCSSLSSSDARLIILILSESFSLLTLSSLYAFSILAFCLRCYYLIIYFFFLFCARYSVFLSDSCFSHLSDSSLFYNTLLRFIFLSFCWEESSPSLSYILRFLVCSRTELVSLIALSERHISSRSFEIC